VSFVKKLTGNRLSQTQLALLGEIFHPLNGFTAYVTIKTAIVGKFRQGSREQLLYVTELTSSEPLFDKLFEFRFFDLNRHVFTLA